MPQQNNGINFIPSAELKQTVENPYVFWFFQTGIYLLFITYIAVLGAFAYRWFNEYQLSQINKSIRDNQAVVASNKAFIASFDSVRSQFSSIGGLLDGYKERNQLLAMIEQTIPEPANLISLTIEKGVMSVEGLTNDYLSVNQWQKSLEQHSLVESVTLKKVERNLTQDANDDFQTDQVVFAFDINLK
ncbi:PilN domain-containing protein [candidate division WWE3 bacterium]|nr:PilN domain-containing protein [candidate division WWE3 bacterium]